MGTQITQRKRHFTEDIYKRLDMLSRGSWKYRQQRKIDLGTIIDDLAKIKALPMQLKNLRPDAVQNLVFFWKRKQLTRKTMQNRLGLLRRLAHTLEIPIAIPTNKELNIQGQTPVKTVVSAAQIDPQISFNLPIASMVQDIFMLQYLFGLKAREAILFEGSMFHPNSVAVARNIAFNKHDRQIPIVTPEQRDFVAHFRRESTRLKEDRDFRRSLIGLHAFAVRKLKLKDADYFRHQFIKNRFLALKESQGQTKALDIVRYEAGYSKLVEVRSILKELKIIDS